MRVKQVLRWLLRRWKWILWGLIVLICLGVWHGLCRGDRKVVSELTDQTAYVRWETDDKPYAQASVYLPEVSQNSRELSTRFTISCLS